MKTLCRFLEWDSAFFDQRIARADIDRLTAETAQALLEGCETQHIDCLYFLAAADDQTTVELAQAHQFRFVDIRLTLETRLPAGQIDPSPAIRPHRAADVPLLKAYARINHTDSRFYYDAGFPRERCAALYETWIERSCQDFADVVLVADVDGKAAGYITCKRQTDGTGQIGLLGVGSDYQGRGFGSQLIRAALNWFAENGMEQVQVVTQSRNVAAQRAYQRQGFVSRQVELWYHYWFL
jgi:ribosomal protein S18 acetylase RimI-like enzyme